MATTKKICTECHSAIYGRIDKRFCDDACRNSYNNRLNREQHKLTQAINTILRKNRRILEELLGEEKMTKIERADLLNAGYNIKYQTHLVQNNKGKIYTFVYNYGFLELKNNYVLIVKQ